MDKQLHPTVIQQAQQFFRQDDMGGQTSTIKNLDIPRASSLNQNDALEIPKASSFISSDREAYWSFPSTKQRLLPSLERALS